MDKINTRTAILTELRCAKSVVVNFIRADGVHRTLYASLNPAVVPESAWPKNTKGFEATQPDPDIIRCYDTEKKAWRSFRLDSVTNWQAS